MPLPPTFPRGKLTADDCGALKMSFTVRDNTLIIDFGKPVAWLGFGLHDLTQLREVLERYELELRQVSA